MRNLLSILLLLLIVSGVKAQNTGTIKGKVTDKETLLPIQSAIIELSNGEKTVSDIDGEFHFNEVDLKSYQIKVSFIGYTTVIKTDIVVDASKPAIINIELIPTTLTTDEIEVTSSYFQKDPTVNVSSTNLDFEEVRRSPGAVEDIGRMLQSAPGISINNDQRSDLIVRGGSPSENLILVDGIEVPNINHFGSQGSTGGPISLINLKFMEDANVYTGGFPSLYGDKLSSVIDLQFREGSTKHFYNNIDLSLQGFGGTFEGPITSKLSYLVSLKRSYLDVIKDAIRLTSIPVYWDMNYKFTYKPDEENRISFLGFGALDRIDFSKEDVEDDEVDLYGNTLVERQVFTTGVNFTRSLKNGYLENIISIHYLNDEIIQYDSNDIDFDFHNKANEVIVSYNSTYTHRLSKMYSLKSGIGGKYINSRNRIFYTPRLTYTGYSIPGQDSDIRINSYKLFVFLNFTGKFLNEKLTLNLGSRLDHFEHIRLKNYFSPRIGISYKISSHTTINGAYGVYFQSPEYLWLSSDEFNQNLNSMRADHYVSGIEQIIGKDIRILLEGYYKHYKDYPVSYDNPTYILVNGGAEYGPNLIGKAVSTGTGEVTGIDFSIQKKLIGNGFYGQINYSYMHSSFNATVGGAVPNSFDQTHQLTVIAGYQVSDDWLFGMKIRYATGKPYTPFDIESSQLINRGVYDMDYYNEYRLPDYIRFDLRADKKFNFNKITLVTYLELQNLFNRENVNGYFWNEDKIQPATAYHWAFFPLGGVSFQF